MRIALRELVRRPGRFVAATVILTLIASLLMLLGGLLDGLIASSTGAVTAQRADLVVYSATAERSLLRSRVTDAERDAVAAVDGVARVGGLGVVQLGARVPGRGERDLANVALFGFEIPPEGVPDVPPPGDAYADETLREDGVEEGMTILLGPRRTPVRVVGFVADTSYSGQGSLWAAPETWRATQNANRPDAAVGPGVFQALVVQVAGGAGAGTVAEEIDRATAGATETLTVAAAADAIGGVEQQRTVFNQIIGLTVVVAVVVVALFFALLTVERTALYGVLKALGARSGSLFRGLAVQALVVTVVASAIGAAVAVALDALLPAGTIPFLLSPWRVVLSAVLLLVAALIGAAFSLRRVLRIDPAAAIGSGS